MIASMVDISNKEEAKPFGDANYRSDHETLDWWPGLSDLDRLNILSNPSEERARVLSAKVSLSLEDTMTKIASFTQIPLVEEIQLSDNPTKLIPLRLIHNFNCLPTSNSSDEKVELVTAWPPTDRMSRWVFAVSGKKPVWRLGIPEKVVHAITENFGIGADSLDDSEFDLEEEEDQKMT